MMASNTSERRRTVARDIVGMPPQPGCGGAPPGIAIPGTCIGACCTGIAGRAGSAGGPAALVAASSASFDPTRRQKSARWRPAPAMSLSGSLNFTQLSQMSCTSACSSSRAWYMPRSSCRVTVPRSIGRLTMSW